MSQWWGEMAVTAVPKGRSQIPFAELPATSSYNFLVGVSDPEEMVERATDLGLSVLSLIDRDGFHGAVRCAEAAVQAGGGTVSGAELPRWVQHPHCLMQGMGCLLISCFIGVLMV